MGKPSHARAIVCKDVAKTIKGISVLQGVSASFRAGGIYGLRGPNGSGKTMLLRAISGLIRIDSGSIRVLGRELGKDVLFAPDTGVVIENVELWGPYTGVENLLMLASVKRRIGKQEVIDAIRRVGLDPDDKRAYRKYSFGMKQRLAIAQAIMKHPRVLLLDEPTNALDDEGQELVAKIIHQEAANGVCAIVASHDRDWLEELCR